MYPFEAGTYLLYYKELETFWLVAGYLPCPSRAHLDSRATFRPDLSRADRLIADRLAAIAPFHQAAIVAVKDAAVPR